MDEGLDVFRLSISIVLLFLVVVGNVRLLFYAEKSLPTNSSITQAVPLICVSSLLAGIVSLTGLIISSWQGAGILVNSSCEVFGLIDHVMVGGANWMLAAVAMERYIRVRAPADHASTFSVRNMRILTCGFYILQLMLAVGPFYGLGEYTCYRGKLPVFVTFNLTSSPQKVTVCEGCGVEEFTAHLRKTLFTLLPQGVPDPSFTISSHLQTRYHVIVGRATWVQDGILFLLRMPNSTILNNFWAIYQNGSLTKLMESNIYTKPVLTALNVAPEVVSYVRLTDYHLMDNNFLPVQNLGICSGDFTSVHQHSDIWMAYNVLLTVMVPCAIATFCCSAVCVWHVQSQVAFDKSNITDEIYFAKALTVVVWIAAVTNMAFIVVHIMFARGTYFSPDTILILIFVVHINQLTLYYVWCLTDGSPVHFMKFAYWNCRKLCNKASSAFKTEENVSKPPSTSQSITPVAV